jgi:hypothetical protein
MICVRGTLVTERKPKFAFFGKPRGATLDQKSDKSLKFSAPSVTTIVNS